MGGSKRLVAIFSIKAVTSFHVDIHGLDFDLDLGLPHPFFFYPSILASSLALFVPDSSHD